MCSVVISAVAKYPAVTERCRLKTSGRSGRLGRLSFPGGITWLGLLSTLSSSRWLGLLSTLSSSRWLGLFSTLSGSKRLGRLNIFGRGTLLDYKFLVSFFFYQLVDLRVDRLYQRKLLFDILNPLIFVLKQPFLSFTCSLKGSILHHQANVCRCVEGVKNLCWLLILIKLWKYKMTWKSSIEIEHTEGGMLLCSSCSTIWISSGNILCRKCYICKYTFQELKQNKKDCHLQKVAVVLYQVMHVHLAPELQDFVQLIFPMQHTRVFKKRYGNKAIRSSIKTYWKLRRHIKTSRLLVLNLRQKLFIAECFFGFFGCIRFFLSSKTCISTIR